MPIYAYRCASCGFEKDHLQKLSDAKLTICPQCSAPTYVKQLTAAGFQLKGNGWYATDFKNGSSKPPASTAPSKTADAKADGASPSPVKPEAAESTPVAAAADGAGACAGS